MILTREILQRSVTRKPFGTFEPFITGNLRLIASFYGRAFATLQISPGISVLREPDHHGSGYASYVSAFLHPSDGEVGVADQETPGLMLYMSRLAPIAIYGGALLGKYQSITMGNSGSGRSNLGAGLMRAAHIATLPNLAPQNLPSGIGWAWQDFLGQIKECLQRHQVEILSPHQLLHPAPVGLVIPTCFAPPHYVFDALFYWKEA